MSSQLKNFIEKEFKEVEGGDYDEFGFYHTPNGKRKDKHGGYYNDDWEYVPGEGWDAANQCYEDDLDDFDEEGEDNEDIDEDDIFDKINYEKNKDKIKYEEDVNSVPLKKEEIKEEKKQNTETDKTAKDSNKPVGGLKGLLSGNSTTTKNSNTEPKRRPQTAVTRGGKK